VSERKDTQDTTPKRFVVPGVTKLYVRVPLERIGVLIGHEGEVLRKVMERTGTKITVDSANGTVVIEPASPATSPYNLLKAQDFVRAIGYGFSPERAMRVLEEDQVLIVIDLKQYVGSNPNHLTRIKGRIIGERGKARKNLEEMSGVYISVYDDYVAIIGDYESANAVKEAIELLIQGRQHSTVYRHLDRLLMRVKRREKLELWYKEKPPWE